MTTVERTRTVPHTAVIGRDSGMFGRVFRLVTGGLAVVGGITGMVARPTGVPWIAGWFLGLAVFYLLLHRLAAWRLSERVDPFLATVLVLGPLGVFTLSVFPDTLHAAVALYIGASLVLTAVMGYGGCEVVALPTMLFRRRSVVYCPINILDAAERPLHRTGSRVERGAAIVALVVAGWYLVVAPILDRIGLPDPVSDGWSLLLVPPAVVLAVRAWSAREARPTAFGYALGAAALLAGAGIITGLVPQDLVFGAAILVGLGLGGVRLVRHLIRRHAGRQMRRWVSTGQSPR